jgi:hypothetical protein
MEGGILIFFNRSLAKVNPIFIGGSQISAKS